MRNFNSINSKIISSWIIEFLVMTLFQKLKTNVHGNKQSNYWRNILFNFINIILLKSMHSTVIFCESMKRY